MRLGNFLACVLSTALPAAAWGQGERRVTVDQVLHEVRRVAPDLAIARAQESVARAEVGIAGVYPNPTATIGTNSQTARLSGSVSVPLVVLGQRGAAVDAARADEATTVLDTSVAWNDIRRSAVRAYVSLWLAEGVAQGRRESAHVAASLEKAVVQRVEVGAAPQLDAVRVHAERVRADADLLDAVAQVSSAASDLGRWMDLADGGALRAGEEMPSPDTAPPLAMLLARIDESALVRRHQMAVRAAEARVAREKTLVRPALSLDMGVDAFDPTLLPPNSNQTPPLNWRAQLTVDLPLFNQRGPYIDRASAEGEVAHAQIRGARVQLSAELTSAYRMFEAATARSQTLADSVVPAAEAAAGATEEAYTLGRVPLVAVLDAERSLIDAKVTALEVRAARADAWADVEHAVGVP